MFSGKYMQYKLSMQENERKFFQTNAFLIFKCLVEE